MKVKINSRILISSLEDAETGEQPIDSSNSLFKEEYRRQKKGFRTDLQDSREEHRLFSSLSVISKNTKNFFQMRKRRRHE